MNAKEGRCWGLMDETFPRTREGCEYRGVKERVGFRILKALSLPSYAGGRYNRIRMNHEWERCRCSQASQQICHATHHTRSPDKPQLARVSLPALEEKKLGKAG